MTTTTKHRRHARLSLPTPQAKFDGDPLNYTAATRVRVAAEYLRVTGEMMGPGGMEKVTTPFIVFHRYAQRGPELRVTGSGGLEGAGIS
eukprot:363886-Chlamydomonas_euryale.AAC.4